MKIIIDEKACLKHKMSLEEFLVALMIRQVKDVKKVTGNLIGKEVIVKKDGNIYVTQRWSEVIDEILCDSSDEQDEGRLLNLAKQMRDLYPAGKMKSRSGLSTPYYYRCNNSEVVKKLKKFFTLFGDRTDEEILDATRRYVASFHGNYGNMRLIKYFILKDDVRLSEDGSGHVEQISDLATFLENGESEEEVTNKEWTTKMI